MNEETAMQQRSDKVAGSPEFQKLMNEAVKLNALPRNLDYKAGRMIKISDAMAALVAPISSCKRGCSHCCYQAVMITTWEADQIAKFTGRKVAETPIYDIKNVDNRQDFVKRYTGKPCVFLAKGECSIYPVRPGMCRTHFSLMADTSLCDTINRPNEQIAMFNFTKLHLQQALMFINHACNFSDIRLFFPDKPA